MKNSPEKTLNPREKELLERYGFIPQSASEAGSNLLDEMTVDEQRWLRETPEHYAKFDKMTKEQLWQARNERLYMLYPFSSTGHLAIVRRPIGEVLSLIQGDIKYIESRLLQLEYSKFAAHPKSRAQGLREYIGLCRKEDKMFI